MLLVKGNVLEIKQDLDKLMIIKLEISINYNKKYYFNPFHALPCIKNSYFIEIS